MIGGKNFAARISKYMAF